MRRREFLTAAGALTGYSLVVHAGGIASPTGPAPADGSPGKTLSSKSKTRVAAEPHMAPIKLECDVVVAGGGMAGVCAAVAAARNGAKVVLVQDRSRLGGNASSEVRMHIVGADCHGGRPGWREGGLLEEFRLDDAVRNPHRSFELWDLLLYEKVVAESNITLLLDTTVYAVEMKGNLIRLVLARCDKTENIYCIRASVCIDCTGDCRLGLEAGAEMRHGREAASEFGESLAPPEADRQTLGSSLLFTARDHGRPMPFVAPGWARKISKEQLRFRPISSWEYGYWWIEWGGQLDTIRENHRIRAELLSVVLGVWDYIKNSGNHPDSATWALEWVGMVPGKRESRRLMGDHILTQHDVLRRESDFEDAVAIGGWPLDDHPPSGIDKWTEPAFTQTKAPDVYGIPLRCLYSRNIGNLMMAGRNISVTHVAFTSARVMGTCAAVGQAAGTAAALCSRYRLSPRQLYREKLHLTELQQTLLRNDQTVKNLGNADPMDLARKASVRASAEHGGSRAVNVVNGLVRDTGTELVNRWAAPLCPESAWIELEWDRPQRISQVQLTFDTGFQRELTLSAQDSVSKRMVRAAQPETVRDYELSYTAPGHSGPVLLVGVTGNYQRVNRHRFKAIDAQSMRLCIKTTNGDPLARLYEVRCYA